MTAEHARIGSPAQLEYLDMFRSSSRPGGGTAARSGAGPRGAVGDGELLERCQPMSSSAVALVDAMVTAGYHESRVPGGTLGYPRSGWMGDEPLDLMEGDEPASLEPGAETEDPELEQAEARIAWHQMVDELNPRLKKVIELRFYQDLTQSQTARRLGVSQTLVSRLERFALDRLRRQVVGAA